MKFQKERTNPAIKFDYETFLDIDTTEKTVSWLKTEGAQTTQPFLAVADLQNPHNIWCLYWRKAAWSGSGKTSRWTENFLRFRKTLSLMISKTVRNLSSISAALTADFVMPATGMKPITGIIHAYYYYLEMVDQQIGEILNALEESNKADNTAILFFADHGEGMASHRMVTKYGVFYEGKQPVPFFACGPRIAGGRRINGVFSLLDPLFPPC